MSKPPKISVLMSVYNGEHYLREAVESILAQTFKDFEFIIIDDGSTDGSLDIIKSLADPRIKLLKNKENLGLTKSLNIGLEQARGQYIARMDDDDIAYSSRLEKQLEYMEAHPDYGLVGSCIEIIDEAGESKGLKKVAIDPKFFKFNLTLGKPSYSHSTFFIRRMVLEDIGGYNEAYRTAQDFDLVSRIAQRYPISNVPVCLLKFRVHEQSLTGRLRLDREDRLNHPGVRVFYNNMKQYYPVTRVDFATYYLAKTRDVKNLAQLWRALWVQRKVYQAFRKQEKLTCKQRRLIHEEYRRLKQRMVMWYGKNCWPRLYKVLMRLSRPTSKE